MAISYVGGVQGGRAGATSTTTQSLSGTLTGGSNSSPSTGDLVIVWCSSGGDGTGAPTNQAVSGNNSGAYTAETFQSITTATYDSFSQFNYKIQGTVDTSLTIPSSGNARNAQRWVVHVFRGVDNTTPIDTASQAASGTATGRPDPAAITPATAGAWILGLYASAAATGAAYTAPTDFATDWLGGTTADTADVMQGGGYYTGWTSGPYDPAAITAGGTTNAADSWTARTVALRPQAAVTHATTGTLTGQGTTVAGSASRFRAVASSGSLTGQGSAIVGSADRQDAPSFVTHSTSGALLGQGSAVSGAAARFRAFASSGVLVGQGASVVGAGSNFTPHGTSGSLAGQGSVVVGSAARVGAPANHATSGDLAGQGASIAGSAARVRVMASTGSLVGQGSVLAGTAARAGAAVTHDTSGSLIGAGAVVDGVALNGTPSPEVQLLGGGPGNLRKDKSSYWHRLLSPPVLQRLEAIEPEIAQAIEVQAVAVLEQPGKQIDAQAEMQRAMDELGFAYKQAYKEIYLELVAEMQQAQEDEQIAAIVAALL